MNFQEMSSIPKNRFEMERNIFNLREYSVSSDGSLNFSFDSYRSVRDIKKARFTPNGRVNLNTIEVGTRLISGMATHFHFNKMDKSTQDI